MLLYSLSQKNSSINETMQNEMAVTKSYIKKHGKKNRSNTISHNLQQNGLEKIVHQLRWLGVGASPEYLRRSGEQCKLSAQ